MWISFSRKRSPSHWELLKWQVLISLYPWFCVCVCTFLFPQCQLYGLFKKTEYIPSSPHLAASWPKSQCSSQKIRSHIAGVTKGLDSTFWRVPWKEFFYDWRNHQIQHSRCPDTSVICYLASENFGDKIRCLAFFFSTFLFPFWTAWATWDDCTHHSFPLLPDDWKRKAEAKFGCAVFFGTHLACSAFSFSIQA